MPQHISDEEVEQFPPIRPRHIIFVDEAIAKLIKAARLISFDLEHPLLRFYLSTPEESKPHVRVVLKDPNLGDFKTYTGDGETMGHALREMLDRVNIDYPLGEEE